MVRPQQPPQIYPLGHPGTGTDGRFTFGVVLEVADVLAKYGYPDIVSAGSGADALNLQDALFTFIYGQADDRCQHAPGVLCGRCIESDREYRAHAAHGVPRSDCPYCPDSADNTEPAASPADPFDPLGILNGSHVSNCPVLTDPNPVPADCICVG